MCDTDHLKITHVVVLYSVRKALKMPKDQKIRQLSKELNDAASLYQSGVDELITVTVVKYEKYASGGTCLDKNKSVNECRRKGGK